MYRQGFHLLQGHRTSKTIHTGKNENEEPTNDQQADRPESSRSGKWTISRMFRHKKADSSAHTEERSDGSSSDTDDDEPIRGVRTPLVDPSTNVDPLREPLSEDETGPRPNPNPKAIEQEIQARKRKKRKDVSKHTFFIENSQMKLKLFARSAVSNSFPVSWCQRRWWFNSSSSQRQMQQWIAALERTAATSHWTGQNRFDSYAPIRLNVAAQWLVDGVSYHIFHLDVTVSSSFFCSVIIFGTFRVLCCWPGERYISMIGGFHLVALSYPLRVVQCLQFLF